MSTRVKNRKSNSNTAAVRFPKLELAAIYGGALIGGYVHDMIRRE